MSKKSNTGGFIDWLAGIALLLVVFAVIAVIAGSVLLYTLAYFDILDFTWKGAALLGVCFWLLASVFGVRKTKEVHNHYYGAPEKPRKKKKKPGKKKPARKKSKSKSKRKR